MTDPEQPTARRQLGAVIEFQRKNFGKDVRRVARVCGSSISDVEAWERGSVVPSSSQWMRLKTAVSRNLHAYGELYQRARAEEQAERDIITKGIQMHTNGSNGHKAKIGTNIGEKIGASLPPITTVPSSTKPAPDSPTAAVFNPRPADARTVNPGQPVGYVEMAPPKATPKPDSAMVQLGAANRGTAKDGRRLPPIVPAGALVQSALDRRKAFVRELLRSRPRMRTSGGDSVVEAVRKTFGIGISPEFVEEIRDQLNRETLKAEIQADLEATAAQPTIARIAEADRVIEQPNNGQTGAVNTGDLEAAVQLVLGAVPNLRTFSIRVDDDGEASIDYTVREVVVRENTGAFKVRRG